MILPMVKKDNVIKEVMSLEHKHVIMVKVKDGLFAAIKAAAKKKDLPVAAYARSVIAQHVVKDNKE